MTTLPDYLSDQTADAIRQRMLGNMPSDIDVNEGSFVWDAVSPAAIELAQAAIWAQEVLRRGFASTTFGAYLDLRCEEHGITRRPAVAATGQVKITGTPGKTIPAGSLTVATEADPLTGTPSVSFITTQDAVIDSTGTVYAPIQATDPGKAGNVPVGAIKVIVTPVPGVAGVTNDAPTTGGLDIEDDASLLSRYLQRVRNPSTGGNKADYVAWAMEVPGVGGVSVVPVRYGPGTVSVAIISADKVPPDQTLVDAVQNYIAPPWVNTVEAETMTIGGYGVSVDTTQTDDTGDSVKMVYDSTGVGTVTHSGVQAILQQPGIWQVRPRIKVDNTSGTLDLLQVGVWNVSANAWAKVSPSSSTDAVKTFRAVDLSAAFDDLRSIVEFYWNGQDQLELRITRLQTDAATTVWVDQVTYRSTFSKDTGEGKAPVGARVTVQGADTVMINVSATLVVAPGYNADSVKASAQQAVANYIRSLAFADDNDVRYVRIVQAILDTVGVQDYSNLLVNGGTSNIAIGVQEVAVLGAVTWT